MTLRASDYDGDWADFEDPKEAESWLFAKSKVPWWLADSDRHTIIRAHWDPERVMFHLLSGSDIDLGTIVEIESAPASLPDLAPALLEEGIAPADVEIEPAPEFATGGIITESQSVLVGSAELRCYPIRPLPLSVGIQINVDPAADPNELAQAIIDEVRKRAPRRAGVELIEAPPEVPTETGDFSRPTGAPDAYEETSTTEPPAAGPPEPLVVTDPGVYNIPDVDYHRDPVAGASLSASGARQLLESPAKFHWARVNGIREHKATFDFGHAAHALVLGVGAPVVVVDAPDWRTKAAKEERDEAREAGSSPVLAEDWEQVKAMAAAIRAHPLASRLLDPEHGTAEQSLFWRDGDTDVMLRCRLDWLPARMGRRRLIIPDYKTAIAADAKSFGRAAASYGYAMQADWYLEGVGALLDVHDAAFVFIVQEKDPPFLVNVIELAHSALMIGAERNRRAIDLYAECMATGEWPGFGPGVELASLPRWAELEHEEQKEIEQW